MNANASLRVHLTADGVATEEDLYLGNSAMNLSDDDELALTNAFAFETASAYEDFVAWGSAPEVSTRIGIAADALLWPDTAFVELEAGKSAIVATGNVTTPTGYSLDVSDCR